MSTCTSCGASPVIARGYCSRCYRTAARGRVPRPEKLEPLDKPTRLTVILPAALAKKAKKAAGSTGLSGWLRQLVEQAVQG